MCDGYRKGDYYRYLAEFAQKKDRERYGELSLNAYKLAYKHALATLDPVHPTRLGLALNFSVFYHGESIRQCLETARLPEVSTESDEHRCA